MNEIPDVVERHDNHDAAAQRINRSQALKHRRHYDHDDRIPASTMREEFLNVAESPMVQIATIAESMPGSLNRRQDPRAPPGQLRRPGDHGDGRRDNGDLYGDSHLRRPR
jgi:hypothetical protein